MHASCGHWMVKTGLENDRSPVTSRNGDVSSGISADSIRLIGLLCLCESKDFCFTFYNLTSRSRTWSKTCFTALAQFNVKCYSQMLQYYSFSALSWSARSRVTGTPLASRFPCPPGHCHFPARSSEEGGSHRGWNHRHPVRYSAPSNGPAVRTCGTN